MKVNEKWMNVKHGTKVALDGEILGWGTFREEGGVQRLVGEGGEN